MVRNASFGLTGTGWGGRSSALAAAVLLLPGLLTFQPPSAALPVHLQQQAACKPLPILLLLLQQ
jgi:hypothetical protein